MSYAVEIQAVDGSWSEVYREWVSVDTYKNLVETFNKMRANSTGARLRLIKILRED